MKFAFHTLGCKVNLFETQALMQLAAERGHEIVDQGADAVIVNTCTVTAVSDHKNIRAFHKMRRDNPNAVIAACGCFAQLEPDKVRATGEIDLICGTRNRAAIIIQCEQAAHGAAKPIACQASDRFETLPAGVPRGRTRALLKIEDGCDNFCAYCIIPYARGRVRSMEPQQVEREVSRLETLGVHEIVLTGIELSSYGRDLMPKTALVPLLSALLARHPDMRFRLGSLDPRTADAAFCAALSGFDNLARHFHLSLQSGSDGVLRRMNRKYDTALFYHNIAALRHAFPDCSVTTDLIVGFPGETEDEFQQTMDFLERCEFASVHVFPYSRRAGTRADQMEGQVPQPVKESRAARAKELAALLNERYRARFVGRTLSVLPEHCDADGLWSCHSSFSFPVYLSGSGLSKNVPTLACITDLYHDGLRAKKIL